jgi:diaminopimelate decarboxylase
MDYFNYKNGELYAEDISIKKIADEVGTPFYCYSKATMKRHYKAFTDKFKGLDVTVCYAVKANSNISVIKAFADEGSGADVVSEGEIRRALKAGVKPAKIVFSGIGKTLREMQFALEQGVYQINVESEPELRLLSKTAHAMGKVANIAIRINPIIEGGYTHGKITTGTKESKFGVDISLALDLYKLAETLPGIKIQGVSVHIGSQLTDYEPFRAAYVKVAEFVKELEGIGIALETIDLGGGIGIRYGHESETDLEKFANIVRETIAGLNKKLIFEPGRVLVGNAGILVASVIYLKHSVHRNFLIIDAAMNDLVRPTLYGSYHHIIPIEEAVLNRDKEPVDVVGPVCETGDIFAEQRIMPNMESGELLAFRSAGAYGAVMSSNYNTRPLVPEVMVDGSSYHIIRPRQTYDDILTSEGA